MTPQRDPAAGFTLIETMVAMAVLATGLLALAQVFTFGVAAIASGGAHLIARQKATEAVESVYTARDTQTITWGQVLNAADGGIFLDGAGDLTVAGPDGIVSTADDGVIETIVQPGPDGELGTGDDVTERLEQFTREIAITDVSPNLRRIRVTITYIAGGGRREYVIETLISAFA